MGYVVEPPPPGFTSWGEFAERIGLPPGAARGSEERKARAWARSQELTLRGATLLRELDDPTGWCLVMADPESNEFCLHLTGASGRRVAVIEAPQIAATDRMPPGGTAGPASQVGVCEAA